MRKFTGMFLLLFIVTTVAISDSSKVQGWIPHVQDLQVIGEYIAIIVTIVIAFLPSSVRKRIFHIVSAPFRLVWMWIRHAALLSKECIRTWAGYDDWLTELLKISGQGWSKPHFITTLEAAYKKCDTTREKIWFCKKLIAVDPEISEAHNFVHAWGEEGLKRLRLEKRRGDLTRI